MFHGSPVFLLARRGKGSLSEVIETIEDPAQRIVDFMRNPRRQFADRGQFFRVTNLSLQLLGLRHVTRDTKYSKGLPTGPLKRRDTDHDSTHFTQPSHDFDFVHLLGTDIQRILETPSPMTS